MKKNCANCRFSVTDEVSTWCHRFPAQPLIDANGSLSSWWSPVKPGHWCGEFKRAWSRLFRGNGKT